jgi:hypothetical protein
MFSGKHINHLLYHLPTRFVPTVCVDLSHMAKFVMQELCVYCEARIEHLYIFKAIRTLCL